MLAQILAIAVALGSGLLFLTAFIFPKLHRQDDFFWSAVGLFYALILWVCAGQMAGAILLGQLASVILLGWFAWETLRLRQAIADPTKIPDLNKVSLVAYVKDRFKKAPAVSTKTKAAKTETAAETEKPDDSATATPETETPTETEPSVTITETQADQPPSPVASDEMPEANASTEVTPDEVAIVTEDEVTASATPEAEVSPEPQTPDDKTAPDKTDSENISSPPITAQPSKKGFGFGRLFGKKAASPKTPQPAPATPEPTTAGGDSDIDAIFGDEEVSETAPTSEVSDPAEVVTESSETTSSQDLVDPETSTETSLDSDPEATPEPEDSPKETP
ncbi:Ycf66 family protein [Picosynechococcus sp. NKBG15041c]|uniref:Ycf66 family protein n=1 Tax=Picosynechococcus sp. NKBG15041c TaxID=1407650 RepID=UPI0003FB6147|nr:Ycf66 family protein [Picosynechococcus sp. NKBG15041c]